MGTFCGVSEPLKLKRPTIELTPSRIRRDPAREEKKIEARSQERDIWLGVTGITIFAAAIATLTVGFSVITGKDGAAAASTSAVQSFGPCEGGADCVVDGETIRIGGATVKIAGMAAPSAKSPSCPDEEQLAADAAHQLTEILNSTATACSPTRSSR